ncbi:MAG: hypothetical protein ACRDRG_08110 [Pseudonocardiaceae bacterium]
MTEVAQASSGPGGALTVFDASVLVDALLVAGPVGDDAHEVLRSLSVLHVR